jgi:oligopeptide/dipeptide ABC transporter ATP-binding protein
LKNTKKERAGENNMAEKKALLSVQDLTVDLMTSRGVVYAVNGVSFSVARGEIHGIIGESGCGKSVTVKAIMRLFDKKRSRVRGSAALNGRELLELSEPEMRRLRGTQIAIIFQEPTTFLSPLEKTGDQIGGIFKNHPSLKIPQVREKVLSLMEQVKLLPAEKRISEYPFELSGGQQQRVMIAAAVACGPDLLIADEPTTALDVTIQVQILELLRELRDKTGMAVLLITHNFGVVAGICDQVSVMYAGRIVETADVKTLLFSPVHPYTRHLLDCVPRGRAQEGRLRSISGSPPRLWERPRGCAFASRCFMADGACAVLPEPDEISPGHIVSCHHAQGRGAL